MKYISIRTAFLALVLLLVSCGKEESRPGNYFTIFGQDLSINALRITKVVLGGENASDELDLHQLVFYSIYHADTSFLLISLLDSFSNDLQGTWASLDLLNDSSRGIVPFSFDAASGFRSSLGNEYSTGAGGSISISKAGDQWIIKLSNISIGEYGDPFDVIEPTGDAKYTEETRVSGYFKGKVTIQSAGTASIPDKSLAFPRLRRF